MVNYTHHLQLLTISGDALPFRDSIIREARSAGLGISGLESKMAKKRVKIHSVPAAHYVSRGSFGTERLQEELELENDAVRLPAAVRWLGRQGPLCGVNDRGVLGRFPSLGRDDLRPPSEE